MQADESLGRINPTDRDWIEDFALPEGQTQIRCGDCGQHFHGMLGRQTCKLCAYKTPPSPSRREYQPYG